MAPTSTPEYAVTDGTIVPVAGANGNGWNSLGGDTGQGPEVTRGLFPPHLHLGWYDAAAARSVVISGAMNPYPLLEWIKANSGTITGGSNARYCEAPQTGAPDAESDLETTASE